VPVDKWASWPDDFVARLFGEGAQIAFLSGTGLVGGGYPAIQRCGLSQLNPSRQTPRKRAFSCGGVLVYSKYTSKGTGMPHRERQVFGAQHVVAHHHKGTSGTSDRSAALRSLIMKSLKFVLAATV
jgi:hypothetical protein